MTTGFEVSHVQVIRLGKGLGTFNLKPAHLAILGTLNTFGLQDVVFPS